MFWNKKNNLLSWQRAVIENSPDYIVQTEEQLRKMTDILVQNDIRIIRESMDIILSTRNPETKKSRQQVMADRIRHLEKLEHLQLFQTRRCCNRLRNC